MRCWQYIVIENNGEIRNLTIRAGDDVHLEIYKKHCTFRFYVQCNWKIKETGGLKW